MAWPESEANHSSPSSIKAMSVGLYLSPLACVYYVVIMQRDSVTCIWQKHGKLHSFLEK
jgi:hypothetical protein